MPGKANIRLQRGDLVIVESCGGGGYGKAILSSDARPNNIGVEQS
jgi:N-methylhydantoinase B/oxoprolinase/acetone carboxylase alpha subunit